MLPRHGKTVKRSYVCDVRRLLLRHSHLSPPLTPTHEIILWWDDEDACYFAEAPELPGCKPHGDTLDEALGNIQEAMALWIETAREFGREVPAPRGRLLFA